MSSGWNIFSDKSITRVKLEAWLDFIFVPHGPRSHRVGIVLWSKHGRKQHWFFKLFPKQKQIYTGFTRESHPLYFSAPDWMQTETLEKTPQGVFKWAASSQQSAVMHLHPAAPRTLCVFKCVFCLVVFSRGNATWTAGPQHELLRSQPSLDLLTSLWTWGEEAEWLVRNVINRVISQL